MEIFLYYFAAFSLGGAWGYRRHMIVSGERISKLYQRLKRNKQECFGERNRHAIENALRTVEFILSLTSKCKFHPDSWEAGQGLLHECDLRDLE